MRTLSPKEFRLTYRMDSEAFGILLERVRPAITDTHYNFYLSQLRITIEQSFGILVRRWGVLWRPMECKFNKTPHVAMCCMRLHNFCIDNNVNLVWRRPPTRQPGHAAQMAAHQPIIDR